MPHYSLTQNSFTKSLPQSIFLATGTQKQNSVLVLKKFSVVWKTCKILYIFCMINAEGGKHFLKGPGSKYFRLYCPKGKIKVIII